MLAGSDAAWAWPERAPVEPGVAFLEGAASVVVADAAFSMRVSESAAGVAFARAVGARGATRASLFAAPAAPRALVALARGDFLAAAFATALAAFPTGARGAT